MRRDDGLVNFYQIPSNEFSYTLGGTCFCSPCSYNAYFAFAHTTQLPLWTDYADPQDYLHQSRLPLASGTWIPEGVEGFIPGRSPFPLSYKLAGGEPGRDHSAAENVRAFWHLFL